MKNGKPEPEIYLQTAAALEAPPEKCVVFEDSLSGIEAAKRANMQVVALTTTHKAEELKSSNPALIIENFNQLETKQLLNLVISETND